MDRQIRIVSALIAFSFVILLGATTYIQGIGAESLNQNPYNSRALYRLKYIDRGPIYAGSKKLAFSEKVEGKNRNRPEYIRKYSEDLRKYEHIVGLSNTTLPAFGIENSERVTLMGEGKENLYEQAKQYFTGATKHGNGIRLTLDPKIQEAAWEYLGNMQGAVAVINYQTGEVLASVSKPDFDPSVFTNPKASQEEQQKQSESLKKAAGDPLFNRVLNGNYQPGSTFKIITSAAIFKYTDLTPKSTIKAPISYTPPDTDIPIYNYNRRPCGNGNPTLELAFVHSCNIPFAMQAVDIGYEKMKDTAEDFGFNANSSQNTPLPLAPSVFPEKDPGKALLAQSAFGQYNVRATPLQMALVAATVANNGTQMKPTFIKEILDYKGNSIKKAPVAEVAKTPVDAEVAGKIKTMMLAMMRHNFPAYAKINGISIGGKTGTAEVITTPGQQVNDAWFVAFSDSPDKPYAIAVMVEGKRGGSYAERNLLGSDASMPIAMNIMKVALR